MTVNLILNRLSPTQTQSEYILYTLTFFFPLTPASRVSHYFLKKFNHGMAPVTPFSMLKEIAVKISPQEYIITIGFGATGRLL